MEIAFFYLENTPTTGTYEYLRHAVIIKKDGEERTPERNNFDDVFSDLFKWQNQTGIFLRECCEGGFNQRSARDVMK